MGLQEKLKYSNLVLRTSKINDFRNLPEILYRNSRILPYITVRDRGGTAIYTSLYRMALTPEAGNIVDLSCCKVGCAPG